MAAPFWFRKKQADSPRNHSLVAARLALPQHHAVPFGYREGWVLVVVGGAVGKSAATRF
jgi:hypothetical protein